MLRITIKPKRIIPNCPPLFYDTGVMMLDNIEQKASGTVNLRLIQCDNNVSRRSGLYSYKAVYIDDLTIDNNKQLCVGKIYKVSLSGIHYSITDDVLYIPDILYFDINEVKEDADASELTVPTSTPECTSMP